MTLPPQRYAPTNTARLRAQWRSVDAENRDALQVRRQWMALIGCCQEEIDQHTTCIVFLDLVDELKQLAAALEMAK